MNILVINAGSSSLKYQLFDTSTGDVKSKGVCERIGIGGHLKHTPMNGKPKFEADMDFPTHNEAIAAVLDKLVSKEYGVVDSMAEINAVGHRVLHGGMKFTASQLVTEAVKDAIKECFPLGPLHNPANLMGIEACEKAMPGVPQVAVFDTAFHQTMPPEAYLYAIPYEYFEKYTIRRYGFHGTSHRYVSAQAAKMLGKPIEDLKIITCHLGNGSSICAVKNGKSVDTSMGFTPLAGVPMGTRSGNIDPSIISFLMDQEGIDIENMLEILNKKSGVLGISGVSSDFRDLDAAVEAGNERAQIALNIFMREVKKYIGAYAAVMGGADAVVFTAGVGENNGPMRAKIMEGLEFLGMKIDPVKNDIHGQAAVVSTDDSVNKILVIPTNEEMMIAYDTEAIVSGK